MKVLMFGWEFPPHISGGLGTACEGLTLALNKQEVDIVLVVPKLHGDEVTPFRLVNASEVPIKIRSTRAKLSDVQTGKLNNTVAVNDHETMEASEDPEVRSSRTPIGQSQTRESSDTSHKVHFNTQQAARSSKKESVVNDNMTYGGQTRQTQGEQPKPPATYSIGGLQTISIQSSLKPYASSAIIPNRNIFPDRNYELERTHGLLARRIRKVEGQEAQMHNQKTATSDVNIQVQGENFKIIRAELDLEKMERADAEQHKIIPDKSVNPVIEKHNSVTGDSNVVSDYHEFSNEVYNAIEPSHNGEASDSGGASDNSEGDEGPVLYPFSGRYDNDLLTEVERYADVASEIASGQSFDIIHAHDWMTFNAGVAAKKRSGLKLILHVHATEIDRSGSSPDPNIFALEQRGLLEADHIISVSNWTKQTLVRYYNIPAEKITVVHNGIVSTDAPVKPTIDTLGVPVVSFVGRMTYQKGPLYFVEAAFKVLQRFPNVHFVMAGSGDQLAAVINQVSHLRMDGHFSFTGFLKGKEIERLWSMTHVYVMPSVSEPFGITPLEAIRAGVPVIVSNQAGISEVMPHAMKVDFWNTDALANAICSVISYPRLAKTLATNARQELKKLSWERSAASVKALYESMA